MLAHSPNSLQEFREFSSLAKPLVRRLASIIPENYGQYDQGQIIQKFFQMKKMIDRDQRAINTVDQRGSSMLHLLACGGSEDDIEALAELGANVNAQNKAGMTPLMYATLAGKTGIVRELLKAGADFANIKNMGGYTALDLSEHQPKVRKIFEDIISRPISTRALLMINNRRVAEGHRHMPQEMVRKISEYLFGKESRQGFGRRRRSSRRGSRRN
jgi:hypothetical protein